MLEATLAEPNSPATLELPAGALLPWGVDNVATGQIVLVWDTAPPVPLVDTSLAYYVTSDTQVPIQIAFGEQVRATDPACLPACHMPLAAAAPRAWPPSPPRPPSPSPTRGQQTPANAPPSLQVVSQDPLSMFSITVTNPDTGGAAGARVDAVASLAGGTLSVLVTLDEGVESADIR